MGKQQVNGRMASFFTPLVNGSMSSCAIGAIGIGMDGQQVGVPVRFSRPLKQVL